jgi:hypothetical protein
MFGPDTGTLNVLIAGKQNSLWTKRYKTNVLGYHNMKFFYSGDLGNRWRYGHVTVQSDEPYQIAFEGIVGTSFQVRQKNEIHKI